MFLLKLGSELQNLVKKFAVQYENINKLQTAFPRSGMHRGGVFERGVDTPMHTMLFVLGRQLLYCLHLF